MTRSGKKPETCKNTEQKWGREQTWKTRLQLPWNSMLRPMLLVLLELENSLRRAVRMEQASVCCRDTQVKGYTKCFTEVTREYHQSRTKKSLRVLHVGGLALCPKSILHTNSKQVVSRVSLAWKSDKIKMSMFPEYFLDTIVLQCTKETEQLLTAAKH